MYCVIDIGSNTIRLVVYRVDDGKIKAILNTKYTAGLAGYVDDKNFMSQKGINKLITILKEFKEVIAALPDCRVYPFATASLRNIVNTEQVLELVYQETGLEIRVLSGYEEAMLDYRGAICSLSLASGLMVDIGGGSTELVFFKEKKVLAARSIPIGSLNLYRNFVSHVLPKKDELSIMKDEIYYALETTMPPCDEYISQPLCGVGGTARAAFSLYQDINKNDTTDLEYDVDFLNKIIRRAEEKPRKLTKRILKIAPERVHTLVPGMLILDCIAELYGSHTVLTTWYGVREGYLSYMLEKERENGD